MPAGIGALEILALGAFVIVIGLIFAFAFYAASKRSRRAPALPVQRLTPEELEHRVHELVAQNAPIQAIKLVRQQTGLGLKEAKAYVDDLAAGRLPRQRPITRGTNGDLAGRVRKLIQDGYGEQAVLLVRGETGMSQDEAERFIASLTV